MSWPDPSKIVDAAKAAGGWLYDKAAATGQAGLDRARELAAAAKDRALQAAAEVEARARQLAAAAEAKARQLAAAAEAKARQLAAAAEAKARQATAAAERIAREKVRAAQAAAIDGLSEPVAKGSEAYQDGKAAVVGAKKRVGQAYDDVKSMFGMDPPCPTGKCPVVAAPSTKPTDGGFVVPTEECPAGSIPADPNNVPAAIAKAKAASPQSQSDCCKARPASERNRTVYYINGINTPPAAHCKTLRMLRDMTCGKVIGIINDTEGAATDAIRTGDARQMIKDEMAGRAPRDYAGFSPAVHTMKEVMVHEATSGGHPLIYAHSEGAAITSLAATRAKNMLASGGMEEAMGNLSITSMGGAAPAWPDGPIYKHVIHVQDVVPNTLGLGDKALRPGAGAEIIRFGGREVGGFATEQVGDKRPFAMWSPGGDPVFDHYADTSYIPYLNGAGAGCFGKP